LSQTRGYKNRKEVKAFMQKVWPTDLDLKPLDLGKNHPHQAQTHKPSENPLDSAKITQSEVLSRWESPHGISHLGNLGNVFPDSSQMGKLSSDWLPDDKNLSRWASRWRNFSQMRPKIDTSDFMKSRDFAMRS